MPNTFTYRGRTYEKRWREEKSSESRSTYYSGYTDKIVGWVVPEMKYRKETGFWMIHIVRECIGADKDVEIGGMNLSAAHDTFRHILIENGWEKA